MFAMSQTYAKNPSVGVGAFIAVFVFLWYDRFLSQKKAQGKTWAHREEYRRLPLACAGGPLYGLSLFWLVGFPYARIMSATNPD